MPEARSWESGDPLELDVGAQEDACPVLRQRIAAARLLQAARERHVFLGARLRFLKVLNLGAHDGDAAEAVAVAT